MAVDIVERLRKQGREVCVEFVPLIPQENVYEWRADPLCAEAAGEIERLRAALETLQREHLTCTPLRRANIIDTALGGEAG